MIISTCPIAWRNQYNLTHMTVLESPRTTLLDLENTEKVFVEKYNKKAKANKAKIATASKAGEACVPRKRAMLKSLGIPTPRNPHYQVLAIPICLSPQVFQITNYLAYRDFCSNTLHTTTTIE